MQLVRGVFRASADKRMSQSSFARPPVSTNRDGRVRRVGVEIEFAGLPLEDAIAVVTRLYGGTARMRNRFECCIEGARWGEFRVEIDSAVLLEQKHVEMMDRLGFGERTQVMVEDAITAMVTKWVPVEIVTPPIPIDEVHEVEAIRDALLLGQARGTHASILYGFAFQLNPEVPSLDADSLRTHLQAFFLLYDWLLEVCKPDFTRRIGPFIQPFSDDYRAKVVDPTYRPGIDRLIDDYLLANPTRNRPLDMLPVFAMLRREKVLAVARERTKVKPRPTFHYRLPNCQVDEKDWSFSTEWNRWIEVERLAADDARRNELGRAFLSRARDRALHRDSWVDEVEQAMG